MDHIYSETFVVDADEVPTVEDFRGIASSEGWVKLIVDQGYVRLLLLQFLQRFCTCLFRLFSVSKS